MLCDENHSHRNVIQIKLASEVTQKVCRTCTILDENVDLLKIVGPQFLFPFRADKCIPFELRIIFQIKNPIQFTPQFVQQRSKTNLTFSFGNLLFKQLGKIIFQTRNLFTKIIRYKKLNPIGQFPTMDILNVSLIN